MRGELKAGKVFCRLIPFIQGVDEEESDETLECWGVSECWLQMSDVSLNPWCVELHHMALAEGDDFLMANARGDEVALKVTRLVMSHGGYDYDYLRDVDVLGDRVASVR